MDARAECQIEEPVQVTDRYWATVADQAGLLRWAAPRCRVRGGWLHDSQALGVTDGRDGPLRAVGVINCFHDQGAWVHIAAAGAVPRPMAACLAPMFDFAFNVAQLRRISARIPVGNLPAQILALRLGFSVEGRERAALDGEDVAVFAMLREDAPWLQQEAF